MRRSRGESRAWIEFSERTPVWLADDAVRCEPVSPCIFGKCREITTKCRDDTKHPQLKATGFQQFDYALPTLGAGRLRFASREDQRITSRFIGRHDVHIRGAGAENQIQDRGAPKACWRTLVGRESDRVA